MNLTQNPFHVLNATPRDDRRRIMELSDERSLLLNSGDCMQARSDLTNPRKRLSAEVAWLPGLSPKNAEKALTWLAKPVQGMPPSKTLEALSPLVRANLLSSGLQNLAIRNSSVVAEWILALAWAFEEIDLEKLCGVVNEERVVSGFPEVTDLTAVEAEVQERRRHYLQVINSVLENLPSEELVETVTATIESATDDGEAQAPILIDDLVDSYEVKAQEFLEKEEENIKALVDQLREAADAKRQDSTLAQLVSQLIQVVQNWDLIAQPIQVSTKSRGLDHTPSHRVGGLVRGLAVHLFNEHGKLDLSQQLTKALQETFAEVGDISERTAEDANALDEIAEQRVLMIEDAKKRADEWRREITYEANVGAIFKTKLRISPEGIEWKGRRWELESISRVRWGGTKRSYNGIPTGTIYNINFGNGRDYASIELQREEIYSNFVDRLWKAVGVRLLTQYLEGLRDGEKYRFRSAVISDCGMEFERKKIFASNERVFCRWNEIVIWNGNGCFCIGKKGDKKLAEAFAYQADDNIHVLEAAIRAFWKRGGDRLSDLLKG